MARSSRAAAKILKGEVEDVEVIDAETGEIEEMENGAGVPPLALTVATFEIPKGIKLKKLITVPSLVLKKVGEARLLRITTEMRISQIEDKTKKGGPATICDVTDLETGQPFILLVPTVVKSNLDRDYPENTYVGKDFYIKNLGKHKEAQRHVDYGMAEIELEDLQQAA